MITAASSAVPTRDIADGRKGAGPDKASATETKAGTVSDFEDGRAQLFAEVEAQLDLDLDEDVQSELARWLTILGASVKGQDLKAKIIREAKIAIGALLRESPKLHLARNIRYRMEMDLLRNNGWATSKLVRATDGNAVVIVGLGVLMTTLIGALYYFVLPVLETYVGGYFDHLVPLGDRETLTIATAAFLGGVVSILTRLREFSTLRALCDFDPMFLFMNAALKPYVGIILGLFAYAVLKVDVLPLNPALLGDKVTYTAWLIGFLSGFSERFARDIVSRGEGALTGKSQAEAGQKQATA